MTDNEQPQRTRQGMLERDNHEKIDYRVVRFVDLDDIPQEAIRVSVYESPDGFVSYFREREYYYWYDLDEHEDVFFQRITDTRYRIIHINTTIDGTNYVNLKNIYCQNVVVEINKFKFQYSLN